MKTRILKIIISLIPVSILITSCRNADLKAAQEFGAMASEFQNSTSKLANDIYDSCIRRTKFYPMKDADVRQLQKQEIVNCELINKPAAQRAKQANQVIVKYMIGVGNFASDTNVNFTDSLDAIKNALNNLEIPGIQNAQGQSNKVKLDPTQVNAGINIVGFFLNLAKQGFQRRSLKEAILCTDEPVQSYTKGLTSVFQEGYIDGILMLEQNRITNYYQDYAALLEPEGGRVQDYMVLEKEYASVLDTVLAKRDAALSYIGIIAKTSDAHRQLKAIFTKDDKLISKDELAVRCKPYFAQNIGQQSVSVSVQYPEKRYQISDDERRQIRAIALKYSYDVKPLLKKLNKAF